MRKAILILALILSPIVAKAQQTTVTATVTDPAGKIYAFSTGYAALVCPGNATPTFNGFSMPRTFTITGFDGTGTFTQVVYDVNSIQPTGCGYQWHITYRDGTTSFITGTIVSVTGASVNLSTAISAYAVLLPSTGGGGTPIGLQTNSVTNTVQTILNLKNGSNVTLSADGSGGVTINSATASSPGGSNTQLQFNNSGTFGGASGITTPDGNTIDITGSAVVKGTDPWADITAFGAKAVGFSVFPTTTATCTTGGTSTTISLAAGVFNNGDGVTIYGCGLTNGMSRPSAPSSVTPILATASAIPDAPSTQQVTGPTGSSTYIYAVIARDQFGALTQPSLSTTITNGLAALGLTTLTISTEARSNDVVTITTTGTQLLGVGALVHIDGASNAQFDGWFNVATVNNAGNSFTITGTPMDTRQGAASSATGGTVSYYNANAIVWPAVTGAWEYYICAQRPGDASLKLIGTSAPTGQTAGKYTITSYYDFGATINGGQTYPPYVTNASCVAASATNDPLTTTVVSGGGTTTIVVANGASNAASSQTALYDAAPAILAAAKSIAGGTPNYIGGSIYIPPTKTVGQLTSFPINSYLVIPPGVNIIQSGNLLINETMELSSQVNWDGGWTSSNLEAGQFAFGSWSITTCYYANPCIYSNNVGRGFYQNITLLGSGPTGGNGGTLWMSDDAYNINWRNVSMDSNQDASTDYIGRDLMLRSTQGGGDLYHFDHVSFSGGPGEVLDASWSPLVYFPVSLTSAQATAVNNSLVDMKTVFFNRRGMEWDIAGGAWDLNLDWGYRQGGETPFLTLYSQSGLDGGTVNLTHVLLDTEIEPVITGIGTTNQALFNLMQVRSNSSESGGIPPAISGQRPYAVTYNQSYATYTQGSGVTVLDQNGTTSANVNANYYFSCPENATAPSGVANRDILYCDATAHAFKVINNNGSATALGTIGGTITSNQVAYGSGANLIQGSSSLIFDGTTVTNTAAGGFLSNLYQYAETTAPSAAAGKDLCYGDSTAHRVECSFNNGSFYIMAPISGATVIGNCAQWAAGPVLVDAGSTCGGGSGGANTALSNLSGVGINTTLLPGAVNTVALGSTSFPFTNSFMGPSSTKYFTFGGLSSLTAGRTVTIPDANTNTVQPLGSGTSHEWVSYIDNTGTQNLTQPTLADIGAGAGGSGLLFNFSAAHIELPQGAGYTTTATHNIGINTTTNNIMGWANGTNSIIGAWSSAPTNGNCVSATVSSSNVLLTDAGAACGTVTAASTTTFTNKTINAESTGNTISVPAKAIFPAAGCSGGSTAGPALVTGSTNTPTPQCTGTTVPKGVLQFARGNAAYISSFQLPSDWNSSASTDIQICFTTVDTTNTHVTSFNVQTGFNKTDGTVTDDPSLNSAQAASVTTGASQTSGGQLCATLTGMTMTGSAAGYNFEVAITRNNSGTDTNTDTAVAVKYVTLTFGRSMNAANR